MDYSEFENLDEYKKSRFEIFKNLLLEYNKKYNLTAILDEEGVKIKHFYDSVAPEGLIKEGARVIEIGSGAGFPSIPLKIIRDDLNFTLTESTGKKCDFLNVAVKELNLTGMEVKNCRAEELAHENSYREKYDVAVARAVARLNTLCEYCLPFLKVGGIFIAYKGNVEEEIKESENALKILGGAMKNCFEYSLPSDGAKRCAVVIKKVKSTPTKYPRGRGLERKKPL